MKRRPRSDIVDLLANEDKPMSTAAIAEGLGITLKVACTRVRQLEESGRIEPVGTATRTRDVRWKPTDHTIGKRSREQVSYRAAENLEAMQASMRAQLLAGLRADHVEVSA